MATLHLQHTDGKRKVRNQRRGVKYKLSSESQLGGVRAVKAPCQHSVDNKEEEEEEGSGHHTHTHTDKQTHIQRAVTSSSAPANPPTPLSTARHLSVTSAARVQAAQLQQELHSFTTSPPLLVRKTTQTTSKKQNNNNKTTPNP